MKEIIFFAYAALGKGLSGGDRIFIEFARRWSKTNQIRIFVWNEGYVMCRKQGLNSGQVIFEIASMEPWRKMGFLVNYIARIIQGIITGFSFQLNNSARIYCYSASEFWMDVFPAVILKWRYPKTKWVATWFQTAPNPLVGFATQSRQNKYRFRALLYWFVQQPVKILIAKYADIVLVNNLSEVDEYPKLNEMHKVVVCYGAVDLDAIKKYTLMHRKHVKKYDAVFQGRFHPQKGVLELIDIWETVVHKRPKAVLAMIGDGPLMESVKEKIKEKGLKNNIKLFGYVFDGNTKYRIFSESKIVLHPAYYDSGGMAAAEAMAFGLPGVCFDLKSLKSYYPYGMLKARVEDIRDFADKTVLLLGSTSIYRQKSLEAKRMIQKNWGWNERSTQIIKAVYRYA